jgi:CRP-like cAMP-binding protein
MTEESTALFLTGMPLFASIDPAEIHDLASKSKRRRYKRNEIIFHQDDPAGNLFILMEGYARVTLASSDGRLITLAWLRPRSVFGTISVLDEGVQPETVTAGSACEAIVLDARTFRDFLVAHGEVALNLLRNLALRWRSSLEQLQDMAFLDINARLAKVLLNVAEPHEFPEPDRVAALAGRISQSQLASLIGASRESVNKSLHHFVNQGCIEIREGRVEILDAERLQAHFTH